MWGLYAVMALVLVFGMVVFRGAPYVPSHRRFALAALTELYKLSSQDVLVDIGSGDGVILRLAAQLGAKQAIGYELNPILVMVSRLLARKNPRVMTKLADFWLVDLPPETTVVYVFAVSRDIEKIAAKIQDAATLHGHSLWLITYGAPVSSRSAVRTLNAHNLYLFEPKALQPKKA